MRLLLDTNVLLLLIVGTLQPKAIGRKRLQDFDDEDFAIVAEWAQNTPSHISTPHILTEVSNWLGSGKQLWIEGGTKHLAAYIARLDEIYVPARNLVTDPEFHLLGLADSAIHHLADRATRVISVDYHLCNRLALKGVDVLNPATSERRNETAPRRTPPAA